MAEVVLIHGIGQERRDPERLLSEIWLPAIRNGLMNAGPQQAELAERLDTSSVALAFYGGLFVEAGAQGAAVEDAEQMSADTLDLAEAIAREWIDRAASRSGDEAIRRDGKQALEEVQPLPPGAETMGAAALVRRAISAAARIRIFADPGFAVAERVVWRSLHQVSLYMTNTNSTREDVQRIIHDLITDDTKVIIGHSLGSVAAFEACHSLDRPLPLLITLGSPLGLDTVIWPRIVPSPPAYPSRVQWWVNIADPDDIIAATPALSTRFQPSGSGRLTDHEVQNKFPYHKETDYLEKPEVAYPLAHTLSGTSSSGE